MESFFLHQHQQQHQQQQQQPQQQQQQPQQQQQQMPIVLRSGRRVSFRDAAIRALEISDFYELRYTEAREALENGPASGPEHDRLVRARDKASLAFNKASKATDKAWKRW